MVLSYNQLHIERDDAFWTQNPIFFTESKDKEDQNFIVHGNNTVIGPHIICIPGSINYDSTSVEAGVSNQIKSTYPYKLIAPFLPEKWTHYLFQDHFKVLPHWKKMKTISVSRK